jgi:aryl-alcohol dehydrogenase-like predicted oxidoreductase
MTFGEHFFNIAEVDQKSADAMVARVLDAGINFFDTADVYSYGESETILGRALKNSSVSRDKVIVATKVRLAMSEPAMNGSGDVNNVGLSRQHIFASIEQSLRRLDTDYIDLYQVHGWDLLTPIEETLRALEDLVRSGKVLYPAVSNWSAWQTQRAVDIQERHNWARLQVVQPMYNLVKRQAEVEILPMAEANGIGVIPYSPAGAGLLSGKYFGQASGRLKTNKMYEARYGDKWMFEVAERYVGFCKQKGLHPVSTAIAWVAAHPAVTAPIIGARNVEQLKDSLAAVKVDMTPALRAELAELSRTPPPATDRSEEQKVAKAA